MAVQLDLALAKHQERAVLGHVPAVVERQNKHVKSLRIAEMMCGQIYLKINQ